MQKLNRLGETFGLLEVIREAGSTARGSATWECECACGRHVIYRGSELHAYGAWKCGGPVHEHTQYIARRTDFRKQGPMNSPTITAGMPVAPAPATPVSVPTPAPPVNPPPTVVPAPATPVSAPEQPGEFAKMLNEAIKAADAEREAQRAARQEANQSKQRNAGAADYDLPA